MRKVSKYLLLYIIFNFLELIIDIFQESVFEGKAIDKKIIIVTFVIKIFYGWMFFLPLLLLFKLCLKILELKRSTNNLIVFILIGVICNSLKFFFSKTTEYMLLSLFINGAVFGLLYFLIIPCSTDRRL